MDVSTNSRYFRSCDWANRKPLGFWTGWKKPLHDSKDEEVVEALHSSGMNQLEILPKHRVCKKHPDLKLDLSGSAKGEIIDQICELLERYGLQNYLVEIGGEIRAHGRGKKEKVDRWT